MKRVSLLLALTSFAVAASAQQNDFFDIQKHLQKRRKENKPVVNPLLTKSLLQNKFTFFQPVNPNNQGRLSHTLSNGDKVYLLSQDNMPCIVPDISKLNFTNISKLTMYPNTFILPGNQPGSIPNVVNPRRIIISK
jgi:hypothetical protein